jgi:hypothetical protein
MPVKIRCTNRRAAVLEMMMADYSSEWNPDPRKPADERKGTAATAAAGAGCLGLATLPFSLILLIIVFFLTLWLLRAFWS